MVRLLRDFEPDPLPVQVVVPSGRAMAPKVRAFLDHAIGCFKALAVIGKPEGGCVVLGAGEKQISFSVVPQKRQWTFMSLHQDRPHLQFLRV